MFQETIIEHAVLPALAPRVASVRSYLNRALACHFDFRAHRRRLKMESVVDGLSFAVRWCNLVDRCTIPPALGGHPQRRLRLDRRGMMGRFTGTTMGWRLSYGLEIRHVGSLPLPSSLGRTLPPVVAYGGIGGAK